MSKHNLILRIVELVLKPLSKIKYCKISLCHCSSSCMSNKNSNENTPIDTPCVTPIEKKEHMFRIRI